MFTVEKAIILAAQYHEGQMHWDGEPYINHLLRVMLKMNTDDERIVAVLHDSFEDTKLTPSLLVARLCPSHLITAISVLTHKQDVSYEEYIDQIKDNPIAVTVKIADLIDNRDLDTLGHAIKPTDINRLVKYGRALETLRGL